MRPCSLFGAGDPEPRLRARIAELEDDLAAARAAADWLRGICGDVVRFHSKMVGRHLSEDRRMPPDWYDLVDRAQTALDATTAPGAAQSSKSIQQ